MGFNYAGEKRIFDKEWKKLAAEYKEAGFDEAGIQAMHDFDWELFCRRRTCENSEQELPSEVIEDNKDESKSTLFTKFPSLTDRFDENSFMGKYSWTQAITDSILADKLSKLSDEDLELVTLFVLDGYKQTEIAVMRGCSQAAICKKIKRIKIYLK